MKQHPCDYGECPFDAMYSEDCRVHCGLGVDEDYEFEEEEDEPYYERIPDYGPSNPWDAPGMKISDFI